jgi:hypothetical protein
MRRPVLGTLLLSLLMTLAAAAVTAREVGGVELPVEVTGAAPATPLRLNGAGVRRKLFVPVYAIGLYLPAPVRDPARVLAVDGPWLVHMHFLHSEVAREKLVAAWEEGFAANHDDAALAALQQRITRFNALFETLHRGDVVVLAFDPGAGATQVTIKGQVRGAIPGADFAAALLRIWLGPAPVSDDLKAALLGG